jgi:hypothetical protein
MRKELMMMDFSNRTLAWLVLATIVVSMLGTVISFNKLNGITALATSMLQDRHQYNFQVKQY